MHIGGVLLGAGMVLSLAPADYRQGGAAIRFTIGEVIETYYEDGLEWVVLDGAVRPTPTSTWHPCRVQVLVAALKRSLLPASA